MMLIRTLLLTAFFSAGTLALASNAMAADGVAIRSGTLRAGPATTYPSIASVSKGESLQIYGCIQGYTWCDVSVEGDRGWLSGSRIAFLRNGRQFSVGNNYASFGLGILTFGIGEYWGQNYSNRSWYNDRRWRGNDHRNDNPRPVVRRPYGQDNQTTVSPTVVRPQRPMPDQPRRPMVRPERNTPDQVQRIRPPNNPVQRVRPSNNGNTTTAVPRVQTPAQNTNPAPNRVIPEAQPNTPRPQGTQPQGQTCKPGTNC